MAARAVGEEPGLRLRCAQGGASCAGGGYIAGRADLVERARRCLFEGGSSPRDEAFTSRKAQMLGHGVRLTLASPAPLTRPARCRACDSDCSLASMMAARATPAEGCKVWHRAIQDAWFALGRCMHVYTQLGGVRSAGLWMAPGKVGEALKGGRCVAHAMASEGYSVRPHGSALERPSFITAVELCSPAAMQSFCGAVQRSSPVGSYITPLPGTLLGGGIACAHSHLGCPLALTPFSHAAPHCTGPGGVPCI